jgi:hypothetical protein
MIHHFHLLLRVIYEHAGTYDASALAVHYSLNRNASGVKLKDMSWADINPCQPVSAGTQT